MIRRFPGPRRPRRRVIGMPSAPRAALPGALAAALSLALGASMLAARPVLAHGGTVPGEPTALSFVLDWSFDPTVWLPALVAALAWRSAVGRVNRAHPANPVPRVRSLAWYAGIAAIMVALDSGIERYDTTLFSVHMVQHMLLVFVAPPLLLYAGPITLLLRVSSGETRHRWILPVLHSRIVRWLSHPVVSWVLFAAVMWGTHFSPLFDLSLENVLVHRLEHALFLGSALLFWWPVIGPDPSPWRMRSPVKVLYAGLQMPQNTFLSVAIFMSTTPLYPHYVTTVRSWGPTPLADQQLAGGLMWIGGDFTFIGAVILLVWAWMREEEQRSVGEDRRLEPERAAIREREAMLAARRAAEAAGSDAGQGGG